MPVTLDWKHVSLRLILTVVAGLIIGANRSEHGRPAGMRTTLLVCLAASIAMIQANLLMNSVGKTHDSFVVLDLMRLPLGILSGMGFIGAGAILRKGGMVVGVTTAATLWFTTVMGLCFGGGQLGLGTAALLLGLGTLWGLRYVEDAMREDTRASLTLILSAEGPSDDEIRAMILGSDCSVISWGVVYSGRGAHREIHAEIQHKAQPGDTRPPTFVALLGHDPRIEQIEWRPQSTSSEGVSPQSQPQGTPLPISAAK